MTKIILIIFIIISINTVFGQNTEKIIYDNKGNISYKYIINNEGDTITEIIYYKSGEIKYLLPIVNGKITGLAKSYNRNGILIKDSHYNNNGVLEKRYRYFKKSTHIYSYTNCKMDKIFHVTQYYKNGKIKKEFNMIFFNGYGPFKLFYKNGNLKIDGIYNGNKRNGTWYFYHEDGSLKQTKEYNNKRVISFR